MASHGMPRSSGTKLLNEHDRQKERRKIEDYKTLVDSVNAHVNEKRYTRETFDLTSKLLQQNPEYYTIWNHRRLILRELLSEDASGNQQKNFDERSAELIKSDLAFLIPLLRKFPKCYWIWNYRLWLLEQASERCLAIDKAQIWEDDLTLASKMLTLDSRNFLAWGYRRTVAAGLETIHGENGTWQTQFTESEFEYTTKMITANLSNFSAWHRRSKLIPRLLSQRKADDDARRQILNEELELVQRALYAGDNDQSIWFYHQALMCSFDPRYANEAATPNLSKSERVEYVSNEMDKVLEMLDGADDCKWIYQALINMSLLYQELCGKWPKQAEGIESWLENLERLDALRVGRWRDLRRKMSEYLRR